MRELLDESEKLRIDSETLEANLESERAAREEAEGTLRIVEAAKEDAEGRAAEYREQAEREGHMARELQSVLEEFQAGQDSELQRALGDYQEKYDRTALAYEEMKEKVRSTEVSMISAARSFSEADRIYAYRLSWRSTRALRSDVNRWRRR